MWNAPRVVIPPPPRTFRKYCAQSEKTATSPSCKQITQPSGAATPRNSDAHKRIAVPKAFCVLWEHPRPSPKSGKTCRSDTRPGDVGERAERSESSDTTPVRNTPVSACEPLCAIFLRKASVYPLSLVKANVGRLFRDVEVRWPMHWKRWYDCVSCAFRAFFEDEKESRRKALELFAPMPIHSSPQCELPQGFAGFGN